MKGVEIVERIGKDGIVTHYRYKGRDQYMPTEKFASATEADFEEKLRQTMLLEKEAKGREEARKKKIEAMSEDERRVYYNCNQALYERWQDETETNTAS